MERAVRRARPERRPRAADGDAFVTNSRKAYEGCAAHTRDAWLNAVSAIPAKRFAKIYDDPEGRNWDDARAPSMRGAEHAMKPRV